MLTIGQAEEDDAVVDRPGQPAVTAPDPREEAFWSSAFCAALAALDQQRQDDHLRRGDKNPARTAIMRLQRAVGCTLADIAREHGLTKERVRQLLAGDDYRARRRTA